MASSIIVFVIVILAIMLMTKKDDTKEIDSATNSLEESESYIQEELEEQLQTELVVNGDSEEQVEKINKFIPDKGAEEIQKTLEQEITQQQENVIDTALKDNAIELHNQETFEVSLNSNNLSSVQEAINSSVLTEAGYRRKIFLACTGCVCGFSLYHHISDSSKPEKMTIVHIKFIVCTRTFFPREKRNFFNLAWDG